jgi:CDP-diacylglycerol--glycerol-3-phosphate 3-phosphatidyltransferase
MLDGYIARKTNTKSILGAKLDSCADMLMFAMIVYVIILFGKESGLSRFYPLIALIITVRIAGMIYAAYKYRSLVMLHTWANKLTGFLVFCTPVIMKLSADTFILYLILTVGLLAAIEEFIIHITAKEPELNRRGLFLK